ncbi:MAG: hypothetical protein U0105_24315 [Candidatus Obscuribacterales bacterium]
MPWPGPNEYSRAVLLPDNFDDPELASGSADRHISAGIPETITGNFACIYRVKGPLKSWAIKCFLRNNSDQAHRYAEIQKHLAQFCIENTIGFRYLDRGIKVEGEWYPIVKMDWVDGYPIDWYIHRNTSDFGTVADVARMFRQMCQRLQTNGMAHGDLHHGNIFVTKQGLRLLDYDGSFVPALAGFSSIELGHPNYQHPARSQSHFGPGLDNFSSWVIYTSLYCLQLDGTLWQKLGAGDECLLFRSFDFGNPTASYTFSLLEAHSSAEIRSAARKLRELCELPPDKVPSLFDWTQQQVGLQPIRSTIVTPRWLSQKEQPAQTTPQSAQAGTQSASVGVPVYPGFRQFNEAVKSPEANFQDAELKQGSCILEDTRVGTMGRVYHFRCPNRHVAVKCFMSEVPNRRERYEALSRSLQGPIREFMVDFEYLPRGISVEGQWYPLLKMSWIDGKLINELSDQVRSDGLVSYLADQFMLMARTLRSAGIAHGDLEFGNLMVSNHDLKIIDYDSMFLPELSRLGSPELGHPGFQHPKRKAADYAPYVDNFSAWLIHFLIKNLNLDPKLYETAEACLLEERKGGDREHVTLRGLEHHPDGLKRQLGTLLRLMISRQLHMIPEIHPDESLQSILARTTKEVTTPGGLLKRKPQR